MTHNPCVHAINQTLHNALTELDYTQSPVHLMQALKKSLEEAKEALFQAYHEGLSIEQLLKMQSCNIDLLLTQLWQNLCADINDSACLIAVGGYGRQEMHPASDIDLLILVNHEPNAKQQQSLSTFITLLWDIKLEVGHSIRTLSQCINEAETDITVITNLIESRYLIGHKPLFSELQEAIQPEHIWSRSEFFYAKLEEQRERYKKYADTAYRVEPNLKEGYGGLRDIQTLHWVILRYYGKQAIHQLTTYGLLTNYEYQELIQHRNFLWKVRFLLHKISEKKEDRLLFHYQKELTKAYLKQETITNKDVESFMQSYYCTISELGRLLEILQNLLKESLLEPNPALIKPINQYFCLVNQRIHLNNTKDLEQHPELFLDIFLHLKDSPYIEGISPITARILRRHLYLINDSFRKNPVCQRLFIKILQQEKGVTRALRCMNRYGILAAYIPAFSGVVGLMQFDLYHAFTVDEHTLQVVRNLRRNTTECGKKELPFCYQLHQQLPKPELLYLAGLFHDIAKGRDGDHSILGSKDAYEFCRLHQLSRRDASLVSWLVQQHLLISGFIQKKDISDPNVIAEFAAYITDVEHLNYLTLLTIADIRGTNMKLWTSWKHTLIKQLYENTHHYLTTEYPNRLINQDIKQEKQDHAIQTLTKEGIEEKCYLNFWQQVEDSYFISNTVTDIIWHARELSQFNINNLQPHLPIVRLRQSNTKNSTLVFIYTNDHDGLFTKIALTFEQSNLNVLRAKINGTKNRCAINTFVLLNYQNLPITNKADQQAIKKRLIENISRPIKLESVNYLPQKRLAQFHIPTQVTFEPIKKSNTTLLEIKTKDAPGILSKISQILYQQQLKVHEAWINTLEEQVQDAFYLTDRQHNMITDLKQQQAIREALCACLTKCVKSNQATA